MINFIVNTHSGKGKGYRTLKKLTKYCHDNNIEFTVHLTNAPGHATLIAKTLVEKNSSTIVAVGGDGTFHEVLNGIPTFEKTHLGLIPSGTGNDFAQGAGIPLDPIKALKMIIDGKTRYVDYIQVGDKRCLNVAGTGIDVAVLKRIEGKHGSARYLKSLLYCITHFEQIELTITADGKTSTHNALIGGVCNGKQLGSGMKICPPAKCDDELLDVVIVKMPPKNKLLGTLITFLRGKHFDLPITTHFTCEKVNIRVTGGYPIQLDGEIYENLPLDCHIVKKGLKTFG